VGVALNRWPEYWEYAQKADYQAVIDFLVLEAASWEPKDYLRPIKLGEMYMASGDFAEAAESFKLAQKMIDLTALRGQTLFSEVLGAALWLAGKKEDALNCWQHKMDAILLTKVTYADLSGGVKVALLLYYGSVTLRRNELLPYVRKFLTRAIKRSAAENMPGPLARIVLNGESFDGVLQMTFGYGNFETCVESAKGDVLLSRQLASVLLCFGSVCREAGNELDARNWFNEIAKIKNHLIEPAWYLVKREAEESELDRVSGRFPLLYD
jgi:tetratricopeptide (TPR) repeat protein